MNKSATSTPRFWPYALLAYGLALGVGALSVNPLVGYAHDQAASYASDAAHQASSTTRLLELQTAQVLDPGNPSYRQQLADRYVAQGDLNQAVLVLGGTTGERIRKAGLLVQLGKPDQAVVVLQGVNGTDAAIARSQAYLEEGSGVNALAAVKDASSDDALLQQALVIAVKGDNSSITPLIAEADSPTTKAQLRQIQSGGVVLAQELYTSGLYRAAQHVLATVPDSSAKALLQAHIWLHMQPLTHDNLINAQMAATQGLRQDPSNLQLRLLLKDIDGQRGDQAGAAHQQDLISQLQSGKL